MNLTPTDLFKAGLCVLAGAPILYAVVFLVLAGGDPDAARWMLAQVFKLVLG